MIGLCQEGKSSPDALWRSAGVSSFLVLRCVCWPLSRGSYSLGVSESASAEFSFCTPSAPPSTYTFKLIVAWTVHSARHRTPQSCTNTELICDAECSDATRTSKKILRKCAKCDSNPSRSLLYN